MTTSSPTTMKPDEAVRVYQKYHVLVRIAHWLNIPILLALISSGLSIYWAAPVFKFGTGGEGKDYFEFVGNVALKLFPEAGGNPRNWFYDHFALGSGNLAYALNIHWLFAYAFMLIALVYVVGSVVGGGYRALIPRSTDLHEAALMIRYYLNVLPAFVLRKANPHPQIGTKYNALQRAAYASVSIFGLMAILSGWAMHKPASLGWLQALLGGYDCARVIHFLVMVSFLGFVIPHVVLVISSGWNCFRSMVIGWSEIGESDHNDR